MAQFNNETFKDINGYEGLYQVSNYGNVKSVKRNILLSPEISNKGYYRVCLYKNGVGKHYYIHRLVADMFIPNPENKPNVDHIDTNTLNNNVDNLQWCSQRENLLNNSITLQNRKNSYNNRKSNIDITAISLVDGTMKNYKSIKSMIDDGFDYSCVQRVMSGERLSHKNHKFINNKIQDYAI